MSARRQFAMLVAAAIAVALAFVALRAAPHRQAEIQTDPGSSADAPRPSGPPAEVVPDTQDSGMDVGDILEPMAGQLADLSAHLREQCAAARPAGGVPSLAAATRCVEAAEAAASAVELVRGTLASAAGRDVSDAIRSRWTRDLDSAAAEVRTSLMPIQKSAGRALASDARSPSAFREWAHLRDRIDRVFAELNLQPT
jgi:hypothetical protein